MNKSILFLLVNLLLSPFTLNAELVDSQQAKKRDEFRQLSTQFLQLRAKYAALNNQDFELEQSQADIAQFIETASDTEIEEAHVGFTQHLVELKQHLVSLEKSIADDPVKHQNALKLSAIEEKYYQLKDQLSMSLSRNKSLNSIFKLNPYQIYYAESVFQQVKDLSNIQEKIALYEKAINDNMAIQQQLEQISPQTAAGIQSMQSQLAQLEIEQNNLAQLESSITPIIDKLKNLKKKTNRYIDDASLNCNAEQVDFSCHSNCEVQSKDPIFGTYKTSYDYNCLSQCNNQQRQAQRSINQEVDDCYYDKDRAMDKMEEINSQAKALHSRGRKIDENMQNQRVTIQSMKSDIRKTLQGYAQLKSNSAKAISQGLIDI